MFQIFDSDGQPLTLYVTIKCNGRKRFRVWCEEYQQRNSKYADRVVDVDGSRTIYFSLPITPNRLFVGCKNADNIADKDFEISVMQVPLAKYDIYIDDEARQFLKFAEKFAQTCGQVNPNPNGTFFATGDRKFRIKYFPVIKDYGSGQAISTPARIGHKSGIIEVAKCKFDRYTVPMRLVILLHEFSHKYRNPKIGLNISNEFGADVNALYLYLGKGYSKIDAICVFAKVFLKAQTDDNIRRIRKLQEYIQRFENQEYAQKI